MNRSLIVNIAAPGLAVCVLLGLVGCATSSQLRGDMQSGFLSDYSMLRKVSVKQANYLYIDKNANWANYTKIWLKPVELWHAQGPESPLGKMSRESQQWLVDSMRVAMVESLTNDFQLVDHGGPDVLVIREALTDGRPSRPAIGVVSSVFLPVRVASFGERLITGSDLGLGKVVIETEALDGQTGQRVAAVVDARAGTQALPNKFGNTWNDVKLAFDGFAQRLHKRLMLLKQGKFSSSGL
jgi:hypothetical protein